MMGKQKGEVKLEQGGAQGDEGSDGDGEIRRTEGGGARRARREDEAGAGVCAEWLNREGDGRKRSAGDKKRRRAENWQP